MNSGDTKTFVTRDIVGIKKVISELYNFMESDREGSYEVNVNNNSININQSGQFAVGVELGKIAASVVNTMKNAGNFIKENIVRTLDSSENLAKEVNWKYYSFYYLSIQDWILLKISFFVVNWIVETNFLEMVTTFRNEPLISENLVNSLRIFFFLLIGIVFPGRIIGRIWVVWRHLISPMFGWNLARVKHQPISLSEKAKLGIYSLIMQLVLVSCGLLVMLLFTQGIPLEGAESIIFSLGVGFVAWREKQRLIEPPEIPKNHRGDMQEDKINIRQSGTFGAGYAKNSQIGQVGERIYNYAPEQKQNLAEAAAEIQQLLDQLSQANPTTTAEKMAVVAEVADQIESNPTLKARVINALKTGGTEALKEAIDHPLVNILVATLDGWREAE